MGNEREKDESERDYEEIHGEEADLASAGGPPPDSEVVEVGGAGDLDEIEDIDEVLRPEPEAPRVAEPGERRGRPERPERGSPQERGRPDRGRDQRGRNDRRGRDRDRDRGREGGDRSRRERGPERVGAGPHDQPPPRAESESHLDPHREPFRDLRRAGRHEPLPEEILPPEEGPAQAAPPETEEEGREWVLLEELEGEPAEQKGRRRERGEPRGEVDELGAATGIDVLEAPREERGRRRGLEPGLSLRDLMPFLRPPRSVIVAGVSTGAGHLRVARALFDGLKALDRNLTVRDIDLLEHVAPTFRPAYVRAVLDDIQRRPALFGTPFETQPPASWEMMPADFDEFLKTLFDEKLEKAMLDRRPEWLVLSHWLPFRWLEAKAAAGVALPKIAAICSDPDYHDWWHSPVVKSWLVSHAEFAQRLIARGVEAEAVQVVGVPVSPVFRGGTSREAAARDLGLRRDLPTILLRPGGIGPAERTVALVKRLLEGQMPMNLLVVAGKNDRLREDLEKAAPPPRSILKAFGFVDNIHELMAVADVLITRATPHTIAEAEAAGLPLVLLRPTPGVEERVADRLLAEGAAVVVRDETSLEMELLDLLRNRRRLRFMHDRALELSQPDGSQAAIEKLMKLIR